MEKNQALVITGESGAGKTFTTNKILDYYAGTQSEERIPAFMSRSEKAQWEANFKAENGVDFGFEHMGVTDKMLQSTPILEAFGNAKMPRNDDSSRFGKIYRVFFDKTDREIIGCDITPYLLEKSRIVGQGKGERGYHIYYQMMKGLDTEQLKAVRLDGKDLTEIKYINPPGFKYTGNEKFKHTGLKFVKGVAVRKEPDCPYCVVKEQIVQVEENGSIIKKKIVYEEPDDENFEDVIKALNNFFQTSGGKNAIGFTPLTQEVMMCTSAVMQMGNIEVRGGVGQTNLQDVCYLLGIDHDKFMWCMEHMTIGTAVGNVIESAAVKMRDALAKTIYNQQFFWLVDSASDCLREHPAANPESSPYIGILDIFGFEYLLDHQLNPPEAMNSFEQFCINLCNERLQLLFVDIIFELEKKLYTAEGLDNVNIDFTKNDETVKILSDGRDSVARSLIDQADRAAKDNQNQDWDGKFLSSVESLINTRKNVNRAGEQMVIKCEWKDYAKDHNGRENDKSKWKVPQGGFKVKHYAATVLYDVQGWNDKNTDRISTDIQKLMQNSSISYIAKYFDLVVNGEDSSAATTLANFKTSLSRLVDDLNGPGIETGFVRCIKSNREKRPNIYEPDLILTQLSYTGMLSTLEIQKAGYASRIPHKRFWAEFRVLDTSTGLDDYEGLVKSIEKRVPDILAGLRHKPKESQQKVPIWVGKQRFVLTRDWLYRALKSEANVIKGAAAVTFQAVYRGITHANSYLARRNACMGEGNLTAKIRGTLNQLKYLQKKYTWMDTTSRASLHTVLRAAMARRRYYSARAKEFEGQNRHDIQRYIYATIMRQRYYEHKDHFFEDERAAKEKERMQKYEEFTIQLNDEMDKEKESEREEQTMMRVEENYLEEIEEVRIMSQVSVEKEKEENACAAAYYRAMEAYQHITEVFETNSQMTEQTLSGDVHFKLLDGATDIVNQALKDQGIEPSCNPSCNVDEYKFTAPPLKPLPIDRENKEEMRAYYYGTSAAAQRRLLELENGEHKQVAPAMSSVVDSVIKRAHDGRLELPPTVPRESRYVSSTMTSNVDPRTLSPHQREAFQSQIAELLHVDPSHVRLSMGPP